MVACLPDMEGTLVGDKAVSVVFDNSKIKRFVPDYVATTRFAQGIRQSLAWFDADPARKLIDSEANATWDQLIDSYEKGLREAVASFQATVTGVMRTGVRPSCVGRGGDARFPLNFEIPRNSTAELCPIRGSGIPGQGHPRNRPIYATSGASSFSGGRAHKNTKKGLASCAR